MWGGEWVQKSASQQRCKRGIDDCASRDRESGAALALAGLGHTLCSPCAGFLSGLGGQGGQSRQRLTPVQDPPASPLWHRPLERLRSFFVCPSPLSPSRAISRRVDLNTTAPLAARQAPANAAQFVLDSTIHRHGRAGCCCWWLELHASPIVAHVWRPHSSRTALCEKPASGALPDEHPFLCAEHVVCQEMALLFLLCTLRCPYEGFHRTSTLRATVGACLYCSCALARAHHCCVRRRRHCTGLPEGICTTRTCGRLLLY